MSTTVQRTCCPTTIDQHHHADLCTGPARPRPFDPQRVCRVLEEVFEARRRLHDVHGLQDHEDGTAFEYLRERAEIAGRECDRAGSQTWRLILRKAYRTALAHADPTALRAALVQVAAVAVEWVEAIDRRTPGAHR